MVMDGEAAVNVVVAELDKLAMCKRGSLEIEVYKRRWEIRRLDNRKYSSEPKFNLKDRKKIYTKNRKSLLALLKYKGSDQLCHMSTKGCRDSVGTHDMFTSKSIQKYQERWSKLVKHPLHDDWVEEGNTISYKLDMLLQEEGQRMSMLDADFDDAKMGFISEAIALSEFRRVKDELEAQTW